MQLQLPAAIATATTTTTTTTNSFSLLHILTSSGLLLILDSRCLTVPLFELRTAPGAREVHLL